MSSVGSFFSYVNDARSHEPEDNFTSLLQSVIIRLETLKSCRKM